MSRSLKQKFVVQKIKNNQIQTDKPPRFKSYPELYLQLISNGSPNVIIDDLYQNQLPQPQVLPPQFTEQNNYDDEIDSDRNIERSRSRSRNMKKNRNKYRYDESDVDISDSQTDDTESNSESESDYDDSRSEYSGSSSNSEESNLSTRLKDLLKDDGMNNNFNSNVRQDNNFAPPTLQELENRGQFSGGGHVPNYPNNAKTIQQEEEEENQKRELLFKFELLKKSYKGANIPELTIHTDLKTIETTYDETVRRLNIESNVESYKNYLIGGFMVVEYGLGHFLKFDMKGFTQQQMVNMNSYNKLLIELGEKTYKPKGKKMPVEMRLLFLILFNAATFVVSKMILKGTGSNLMSMLNNLGENVSGVSNNSKPKKKMNGPNINLDDIPDMI